MCYNSGSLEHESAHALQEIPLQVYPHLSKDRSHQGRTTNIESLHLCLKFLFYFQSAVNAPEEMKTCW